MRHLILSSLLAVGFVVAGSAAYQANAAAWNKGAAPAVAAQTQEVRCYLNAPRDGCGLGRYRTRWGNCRPC